MFKNLDLDQVSIRGPSCCKIMFDLINSQNFLNFNTMTLTNSQSFINFNTMTIFFTVTLNITMG